MARYIELDAVVAEIEKRISRNKKRKEWEDIPEKRHQLIIEGQLLGELKHFIDSLQEEPVSEKKCMFTKDNYTDEDRMILCEDCKEKCECSKKEEPVSEDLGDYINELSKQFPEVSFAMLSGIADMVSRWQRNQDAKNKLPKVINRTDLDEFAYQCAYDMSNDWATDNPTWKDVEDACKLGAQWQKQKEINEIRAEIKRRYEHHLGCMEGSRDDTYLEISHAHHCAIKTELFEILCFLDVLEGKSDVSEANFGKISKD